jgi:hypothetical protein
MTARTIATLKANWHGRDPYDQYVDTVDTMVNPQDAVSFGSAITVAQLPVHATGLGQTLRIPLVSGFDNDYAYVGTAAAVEPDMQLAGTIGTALYAASEPVQNSTKFGQVSFEVALPPHYKAAGTLTLTINAHRVNGSGTTVSGFVSAQAHKMTDAGAFGADIAAAGTSNIGTAAADYTFAITATTLLANDRLVLRPLVSVTEGGNTGTSYGRINSVRLS